MTSCEIEIEFADGEYTFALPLPQIQELQQKTGEGIGTMFGRVVQGVTRVGNDHILSPGHAGFHVLDIVETVRLGLIGGGRGIVNGQEIRVTPVMAKQLVDRYVVPPAAPLSVGWDLAVAILGACIVGFNPPKKAGPAEQPATETTTAT